MMIPIEIQEQLQKKYDNLLALQQYLREDVLSLLNFNDQFENNQSLRKALIRGVCSYFEGCTFALYNYVKLLNRCLPEEERNSLPKIEHNDSAPIKIQKELEWCENRFGIYKSPDIYLKRLEQFKPVFLIRNRLTHPKKAESLFVSEEKIDETCAALMSYIENINDINRFFVTIANRGT